MFMPEVETILEAAILLYVENGTEAITYTNIIAAGVVALISAHLYWKSQYKKLKKAQKTKKTVANYNAPANATNFTDLFNYLWDEAQKDNSALSLFIVGINHFKEYNDTYGRIEAFNCLSSIAEVLMDSIRDKDHVAIYRHEEIAVVLPHTDPKAVKMIAERMFSNVRAKNLPHVSPDAPFVTVSIGCMTCHPSAYEKSRSDFIGKADLALWLAMRNGCESLEIHPEAEC